VSLLHRAWENGTDSGWTKASSIFALPAPPPDSAPAAVGWTIWGSPRVDVFYIDQAQHLRHRFSDSSLNDYTATDDWGTPSGETLFGNPAVASWGDSRLDVLVYTVSGHIAHWWWDHGSGGQDLWPVPANYTVWPNIAFPSPAIAAPAGPNFLWTAYTTRHNFHGVTFPLPAVTLYDNGSLPSTFMLDSVNEIAVCASN
jgi:hypothetical protein